MRFILLIIAALYCAVDAIPSETVDHGRSSTRLLAVGVCENDAAFRWNGKEKFDCTWAGKKKRRKRCHQKDKTSGKKILHHCPLSCKKKCAYSRICERDDPDFKLNNDSTKNCDWAAAKPNTRCKTKDKTTKKKVEESCPSACDLKCSCMDSKKFMNGGKKNFCKEIAESQCSEKTSIPLPPNHKFAPLHPNRKFNPLPTPLLPVSKSQCIPLPVSKSQCITISRLCTTYTMGDSRNYTEYFQGGENPFGTNLRGRKPTTALSKDT
eukprot:jgi/Psemu1/51904/gm1.51904_g